MKKLLTTSLFIIFCFGFCKAQRVTIPDANFVKYLQLTFPSCMNGNQMDTTCPAIVNATTVACSHGNIADLTGIQYFKNITTLNCSYNLLTSLPSLPTSLTYINCNSNNLTTLPALPISLTSLNCNLDALTVLPGLPASLVILDCGNNFLNILPPLPSSLTYLEFVSNTVAVLPTLPASLNYLDCSFNPVDTLPVLPKSLSTLFCSGAGLSVLPAIPTSLLYLSCDENQLTVLPALPQSLIQVACDENQLTVLPALPKTLSILSCGYNQLTILPDLPPVLSVLNVSYNTAVTCLPPLKKYSGYNSGFKISGTSITCLPNVIEHTGSIPAIDTMPICNIFNTHGCEVAWNIKGQVVKDGDGSCATTNDGTPVRNISMKLYSSGNALLQQVYENANGAYSFKTGLGTYNTVVDTAGLPFTVLCPPTDIHTDTLTTADSLDYNSNFRLYCKPGFDLGVNAIINNENFFPNRSVALNIFAGDEANYYGITCNTSGLGGTVTATVGGPVTITSASSYGNAVSSINGSTIIWNVTNFSQVDFNNTFSFILHTDTSASAGQQVCVNTTIAASGTDNNPANNSLIQCYTVLNSYDPNDKEVSPAGAIVPGYDGYLTYTIHFQNTGTAPAENIQVIDTISHNLDISTFQLVAFSNQNITQVFDRNRVVKFSFPNINLPDSTANEPASHGYVQYKIKPLSNLTAGDSINNTAYIYFDFNSPIVTNTTSNTIEVATGLKNISSPASFTIYPNPVSQQLTVSSNQLAVSGEQLAITDLLGRTIIMQTIPTQTKQTTVDVSGLTTGVYFITVHAQNENVVKKFVKE